MYGRMDAGQIEFNGNKEKEFVFLCGAGKKSHARYNNGYGYKCAKI